MFKSLAVTAVTFYQGYIRGLLPCSCRFDPSCSEYAREAFTRYGFLKGLRKALVRLLRCHPFSPKSGYDPLL